MSEYRIKNANWTGALLVTFLLITLVAFPLINTCETEDSIACTWHADTQGNREGHSFTNYYGVNIYHP